MMNRISVALASYNGEQYLKQQLDSILAQTQKVDEIIIYDDGSSDHTLNIMKAYQLQQDINILVFSQKEQVGYIKNFADALKMTSGDFIFLCDQDDIWEADKVEQYMTIFHEQPEISCINSSFTYIDAQGNALKNQEIQNLCWKDMKLNEISTISFEEIVYHNIAMGCTIAFRADLKNTYLEKSNFLAAHDWEINLLAATSGTLAYYNHPMIQYRIHEHNTVGNDKLNKKNHIYANERERNAQSLVNFISGILVYTQYMKPEQIILVKKLDSFHRDRLMYLQTGRKRIWFGLLKRKHIYEKFVTKKGMITDFLYGKNIRLQLEKKVII